MTLRNPQGALTPMFETNGFVLNFLGMETLSSNLDPPSPDFIANSEHHQALAAQLKERLALCPTGAEKKYSPPPGGTGQAVVLKRIQRLLDPGSPVPRTGPAARPGICMPRAVRGHRHRHWACFRSRSAAHRQRCHRQGRHLFPHEVKKHLRAQQSPRKPPALPVSGRFGRGLFAPCQDEVFPDAAHFGRISTTRPHERQIHPADRRCDGQLHAGGAYVPP